MIRRPWLRGRVVAEHLVTNGHQRPAKRVLILTDQPGEDLLSYLTTDDLREDDLIRCRP